MIISALTAFIFGFAPAWQASRTDPNGALREVSAAALVNRADLFAKVSRSSKLRSQWCSLSAQDSSIDSVMRLKTVDPGFDYQESSLPT